MSTNPRRKLIKNAVATALGALAVEDVFGLATKAPESADRVTGSADFFPGFRRVQKQTSGAVINLVIGGKGYYFSTATPKRTLFGENLRRGSRKSSLS